MKQIHLFSHIVETNTEFPVKAQDNEINFKLFFENKKEQKILEKLAQRRNMSVQTLKIIYNLYFNSVFKKVTTSDKKSITISPYYKFLKTK